MRAGAASLVEEGFSQEGFSLVRRESFKRAGAGRATTGSDIPRYGGFESPAPASHLGHGCCQDEARRGSRSLVGVLGRASADGLHNPIPAQSKPVAIVFSLRCRSWRCACCVPRLLRRNRARAIRGAMAGGWVWMLTLTIDPKDERWLAFVRESVTPAGVIERGGRALNLHPEAGDGGRMATAALSLRYAGAAWNRLATQLRKQKGLKGRVAFYCGRELHESGMAHLHVLVRVRAATPWFMQYQALWKLAAAAGFGRIDLQRARRGESVARYVSKAAGMAGAAGIENSRSGSARKNTVPSMAAGIVAGYVSKSAESLPRWTRRGSWSPTWVEDWTRPTPLAGFAWRLGGASAAFISSGLVASGFVVEDPARYRVSRSDRPGAGEGETWQN